MKKIVIILFIILLLLLGSFLIKNKSVKNNTDTNKNINNQDSSWELWKSIYWT